MPVFFKLRGRTVLLGGGTEPAVWKAELLAAAGALVLVCDPAPCPAMIDLAQELGGAVDLRLRAWQDGDFAGAALAIGAFAGGEATAFYNAAHRARVTVNIVDNPDLCDFQFGTIVARSPLLIAISTDGAAPVMGQALRARIEALLPANIGAWAQAAKDWRPSVQERGLGFAARRRFWEEFADRALDGSGRGPSESDRIACLDLAVASESTRRGRLDLVGTGPGAPDLVTLRAVRALQSAEVVIYDPAIDVGVLDLGRRESERVPEPRPIADVVELATHYLALNKRVAIAGLGSPEHCTRWSQRRAALQENDIEYQIVQSLTCTDCLQHCKAVSISGLNDPT